MTTFAMPLPAAEPGSADPLADLVRAVERALGGPAPARRVGAALAAFLADPELLRPEHSLPADGCYARNLLHADPAGRFSVWAMVWRPGQGSSVHDHCCWCVMGVHRGTLTEERFAAPAGQEPPRLRGAARCGIGAVCALEPGVDDIHRIVNRDVETAISVHVYGFDPAVLASSVGQAYAH